MHFTSGGFEKLSFERPLLPLVRCRELVSYDLQRVIPITARTMIDSRTLLPLLERPNSTYGFAGESKIGRNYTYVKHLFPTPPRMLFAAHLEMIPRSAVYPSCRSVLFIDLLLILRVTGHTVYPC